MSRPAAAVALTALLTASLITGTLAGCGLQNTKVNIFDSKPVGVTASPSPVPSMPAGQYDYTLYYLQNNIPRAVPRSSDHKLSDLEIVAQLLAGPNENEKDAGFTNRLPGVLDVRHLGPAQQYDVSPAPTFVSLAGTTQFQLICTLSAYWKANPAGSLRDTVQLTAGHAIADPWNNCNQFDAFDGQDPVASPNSTTATVTHGSVTGT